MVALCSHFSDDVRACATSPLPFPHCFFVTLRSFRFAALAVERLGENSALRRLKMQRESCFKKPRFDALLRPLVEAGVVPPLMVMLSAPKLFSQKNATLALGALAQVRFTQHAPPTASPCSVTAP